MFPDYLEIKKLVIKNLQLMHEMQMNSDREIISQVGFRVVQHEGDKGIIIRENGSVGKSSPKKMESSNSMDFLDVDNFTAMDQDLIWKKMSDDLISQMTKLMFDKITEECDNTDENVTAKTIKETFLIAFEKIDIPFDKLGVLKPGGMFVINPSTYEENKDEIASMNEDKDFLRKIRIIEDRKRKKWFEREANRKLVG